MQICLITFYLFDTYWVLFVLAWLNVPIVGGTTHCLWSIAHLLCGSWKFGWPLLLHCFGVCLECFYSFNTGWVLLVLASLTGLIVGGTTHCLWSTAYLLHILFLKILMALLAALNWWLLSSTDFHLQSLVLNYDLKVVPSSYWLHWGVVAILFPLCHCWLFLLSWQ